MIYDLKQSYDRERANKRLASLIDSKKVIEIKEKRKAKTVSQRNYLHVLFELFGLDVGLTKQEAKTTIKRERKDLFVYTKKGEKYLRSTEDLSKDEYQFFISWFIEFAGMQGIELPSSESYLEHQFQIHQEIEKAKQYL